ncbi:MAG: trehalose-phosphatase [Candidatus Dormibacteria bacterium]
MTARRIRDLPRAVGAERLHARLAARRPAVFLDYDGTLAPIVDRPEDALIDATMRSAVRRLASRCPVCVVSGRDRQVVQRLMGLRNLIVAGSHGFDIWSPTGGCVRREETPAHTELIRDVSRRLRVAMAGIEGASVEVKSVSVAAHYRMVEEPRRAEVRRIVESLLAEHPDRLRVTPGKMVLEIQPNIDWDKGRAVLHLLSTLDLDHDDVVPLYIGDDITDEDAFQAIRERGVGIIVAGTEDGADDRITGARYRLDGVAEVEGFLETLAAGIREGRMVD